MSPAYAEFLTELYRCKSCVDNGRRFANRPPNGEHRRGWDKFKHHEAAGAPYKFPPIGFVPRPLLFVGINPRFTNNGELHREVMSSLSAFKALAENRAFGKPYITPPSDDAQARESFYDDQVRIGRAVFPDQSLRL